MSGGGRATLLPELVASLQRPFRSRRAIDAYQAAALRRLVDHVWRRVPFYRRYLERHGVRPEDLRRPADLARLPPISRRELQEAPLDERIATGVALAECISFETSGSSGEPLRIVRTPREDAWLFGRRLRAQILAGLRPWDLRLNVGFPPRLFRWHRIGAFRILSTPNRHDDGEAMIDRLIELAPDVLMVSPETLQEIVDDAERGHAPRPRQVFSGANQLRPSLRRRAEEILGARVTDFYGTTECNLIAWECRRCGRYHTVDDSVIVEVVRDDGEAAGPGEEGEVLLTALHSFAMPFLRFRIGDLACRPAESLRCNIRFGALERIQGRVIDYLRFPGGLRVGPFALFDALDRLDGLGRWQAVQHTETRVEVRFEALRGVALDPLGAAIETRCREVLPASAELEIHAVDSFPDGTGGAGAATRAKHRFVRSMVS